MRKNLQILNWFVSRYWTLFLPWIAGMSHNEVLTTGYWTKSKNCRHRRLRKQDCLFAILASSIVFNKHKLVFKPEKQQPTNTWGGSPRGSLGTYSSLLFPLPTNITFGTTLCTNRETPTANRGAVYIYWFCKCFQSRFPITNAPTLGKSLSHQ